MKLSICSLFLVFYLYSCTQADRPNKPEIEPEARIEAGFQKLNSSAFILGRHLIAKKGALEGVQALNIKGDRSFRFDERENIIEATSFHPSTC